MKLYSYLFLFIVFVSSCCPLKQIHQNDIQPLSVGDQIVVKNAMVSNDAKLQMNLLGFFKYNNPKVKLCTIKIESESTLIIEYVDSTSINSDKLVKHRFEGELLKNGVFEIYHLKKRIEIPPFIPILYSNVSIQRVRIGLLNDQRLAVEYKYVNTGNWFLMAAGSSSRDTYYFFLSEF